MNTVRERLIHIHHCRGIGWKGIYTLLKYDPTLKKIYHLSQDSLQKLLHRQVSSKNVSIFYTDLHTNFIQTLLEKYHQKKIHIITIMDDQYPLLLKEIYDPPFVLYAAGNLDLLQINKKLSVVGSRTPSSYGINCIKEILSPIIQNDWVIVSGFARGIDTEAHKFTMRNHGKTIAVLGGGFSHIYPPENLGMIKDMIKDHLLLTEYPIHIKPQKWHFPMRNRIISGLSYGTLLIEAKERSGSLITSDLALEQGREVFAIPGSIYEKNSVGTNKLIQQGAKLVLNSDDILMELQDFRC